MRDGTWKFDADTAQRFDEIARTNIPNYEVVIKKCVHVSKTFFPNDYRIKILDVGSANGYTLKEFRDAGYENVYGVDSSREMLAASRIQENLILSAEFPKAHGPFDVVVANWTLHFVQERKQYLKEIYESLNTGGILILSEKMLTSDFVHDRYHDFKRSQGVSEQAIEDKAAAIKGILVERPLSWYVDALKEIGYAEPEIIDASWCFNTLLCRK